MGVRESSTWARDQNCTKRYGPNRKRMKIQKLQPNCKLLMLPMQIIAEELGKNCKGTTDKTRKERASLIELSPVELAW